MVLPEPPALRAGIVLERRGRRGRARRRRRGGARGGGGRGGMSGARDGECARLRGDRDVQRPVTGHDVGRCEREDAGRGRRQGPTLISRISPWPFPMTTAPNWSKTMWIF